MLEEYDDILSVAETSEILKMGHNNVQKLINSEELDGFKYSKTSRRWRIPKDSLIKYITEEGYHQHPSEYRKDKPCMIIG